MTTPSLLRRRVLAAGSALPFLLAGAAIGQPAYPTRQIRAIIPYAPGGALDTVARAVAPAASRMLGQPVVIDNRPGAFTILGTDIVAKAEPDGHTVLFAAAPQAFNTALGLKLPYDPMRDFEYVSLLARIPALFIVHPSLPVHNLKELVEFGKQQPGGLQYATAGVGSMPHLLSEYFFSRAGVKAQHIGYRGSAPALNDLVAGTVKVMIDAYVPSGPQVLAGRARGLAVASAQRTPVLPDVATTGESGYPGFEGYAFYGVAAPARTPKAIVAKLHSAFADAANDRAVRASLIASGYEVIASSPGEYRDFVRKQIAQWTAVVKEAQIQVEQ